MRSGRRLMLWVLKPRPRWWERAGLWLLISCTTLLLFAANQPDSKRIGFGLYYVQHADGSWRAGGLTPGRREMVEFQLQFVWRGKRGWERIIAAPTTFRVESGSPIANLTGFDAGRALRECIDHAIASGEPGPRELAGLSAIRAGKLEQLNGALLYHAERFLLWLVRIVIVLSIVVGSLRLLLWIGFYDRLRIAHAQICPRCEYPLANLPLRICPECGLNIPEEVARTLRLMHMGK